MKIINKKAQYFFGMNTGKRWIVLLLLFAGFAVNAQQEPVYTQYMFNTQNVNPAYAGTWESMGFMALSREQWVGFDNGPSTQTFTFQTLNRNAKVGLGLTIINDKFGLEKRLGVFGDYSYMVKLDHQLKLRLGLKMGFSNYSNNFNNYDVIDDTDPRFQGEIDQKFMPNFGFGLYLYKENFFAGLSVPKMVTNDFKNNYNNYSIQSEVRHFYLMGGYVFNLSENLKFKPTILSKVTPNTPLQIDLSANFLIAERVWLGAMLRSGDSFGFIGQWIINNKLRLGYAIDFTTTQLRNFQNGTHEIMVSYELKTMKKKFTSPRYF